MLPSASNSTSLSTSLFSKINTIKGGYFYTVIDPINTSNSFTSETYLVYAECVSALQMNLLRDEIGRSLLPELIIDPKNFNVIELNYKARKLLSAPVDWEPFNIFPKNKENEILNKALANKNTHEFYRIHGYANVTLGVYCFIKVVSASNGLLLRLTFGCPVLSALQNTEKLFS